MKVCGGWTIQEPVSKENKKVLGIALKGFVGSTFEPIVVATQVVNGVNYVFIAKSTTVTLPPKTGLVKIYVSATPSGTEPKLVNIETIV
ncbi:hypothetical protein [Clostridium estertheticum]|uniref:Uncharacterized protein n=1 Tax=Clostridium estertheticum subsp. estertheticum TaxID=1552 RepID=A0A1J0GCM7_9CLOT|nr:hypothetical protein [Clostridium estertheticum]APC39105.1 hypothetical protein A7L45_02990 [Clostridium estertheticum subsp. estertheticum]MBU3075010.1 hypothetical protein [Clostridium estertheticum]MBU3165225.1 hypothetical protein [Clostridium estertheticum]MBU3173540.1 hypothetical protein [Clostridium estertheticum]MBZ9614925.1 hypothetical protein [Clostridium estertheticum subsp. laramiense]